MWQHFGFLAVSLTAFALLVALTPLIGSTLSMQTSNPRAGVYAARVAVDSSCGAASHTTVGGSISSGTFDGCNTVTSTATVTGSGPVTFRAGERIALQPGFRVEAGAQFVGRIESSLYPDAFMQDDTPAAETRYAARFYLDTTQLTQAPSNRFFPFVAFRDAARPELRVGLKWNGTQSERRLFVEVLEDGGAFHSTENTFELVIPSGWHWVEVGWEAASSPGGNDGSVYLCVDSLVSGCYSKTNLDNVSPGSSTCGSAPWRSHSRAPAPWTSTTSIRGAASTSAPSRHRRAHTTAPPVNLRRGRAASSLRPERLR